MSARETQSGGASRRSNLTRPMKNASATLKQIDPAEERELQRGLTNRHLQLIALGGAIGTGMFMGSSSTIHLAGPSSALIYALIGFFMYFMMRALGEMLLSNLHYKSFRDIAEDLLGPAGGFIAGWTYWFSWIVAAMAEFWFALIKLIAVGALVVVAIVLVATRFVSPDGDPATIANLWNDGGFFPNGVMGFLGGFQIAFFAFVGIELVGTAAAETKDPCTTLPKAINAIPVRLALFYVLALLAITTVIPWRKVVPGVSPFVSLFGLAGFGAAASVMNFVLLTAAASSDNSGLYSTSRMMYGLALDGQAPSRFRKLSGNNVPRNALAASCLLLLCGIIFLYTSDSIMQAFALVTTVAALLFLFSWSLIVVCYIVYRHKSPDLHEESVYKMPGGVPMCWVVLTFFAISLVILALDPTTRIAVLITPIWFVFIGSMYLVYRHRTQRKEGLR